jgi:hypothetical protein
MSQDYLKLTGEAPTSMADFVKLHASEFTRRSHFGGGREVSMQKLRFSERQIAFILTDATAACPRGGTTYCPIVPQVITSGVIDATVSRLPFELL